MSSRAGRRHRAPTMLARWLQWSTDAKRELLDRHSRHAESHRTRAHPSAKSVSVAPAVSRIASDTSQGPSIDHFSAASICIWATIQTTPTVRLSANALPVSVPGQASDPCLESAVAVNRKVAVPLLIVAVPRRSHERRGCGAGRMSPLDAAPAVRRWAILSDPFVRVRSSERDRCFRHQLAEQRSAHQAGQHSQQDLRSRRSSALGWSVKSRPSRCRRQPVWIQRVWSRSKSLIGVASSTALLGPRQFDLPRGRALRGEPLAGST